MKPAIFLSFLPIYLTFVGGVEEEENPYTSMDPSKREPSPCEICKFFVEELKLRLDESGKSKEVIRTGHGLEAKKKVFKYNTSELRLTEALHEPPICKKILEYNVHAERAGSNRYHKGMSETFQTLHGLVNKGVKVELGIPEELWDSPSAEVTKMERACNMLAERYEEDIEDWYYNHQETPLKEFICYDRYLKDKKWTDTACLSEEWTGKELREDVKPKGDTESTDQTKKQKKSKKSASVKGEPEPRTEL